MQMQRPASVFGGSRGGMQMHVGGKGGSIPLPLLLLCLTSKWHDTISHSKQKNTSLNSSSQAAEAAATGLQSHTHTDELGLVLLPPPTLTVQPADSCKQTCLLAHTHSKVILEGRRVFTHTVWLQSALQTDRLMHANTPPDTWVYPRISNMKRTAAGRGREPPD